MRILGASQSLAIPAAHRKQTTRLMIQHNPIEDRAGLSQIIFGRVPQRLSVCWGGNL